MAKKEMDYDPDGLNDEEKAILEGKEPEQEQEQPVETAEAKPEARIEAGEPEKAKVSPAADPNRPDGFVPLKALQGERERANQYEQRLRQYQEWQQQIADKLAAQRTQPEAEAPVPTREEDPLGYIDHIDSRLKQIENQGRQQQEAAEREAQWQRFEHQVNRDFETAAMGDSTLGPAMEYVNRALHDEYQRIHARTGVAWPQFHRDMIRQHAAYAYQAGIPIAEYVRNIAETRGFRPGVVEPQKDNGAAEKVRRIAEAQESNKSLGKGTSGGAGEITLETLAAMDGAELEEFVRKNPDEYARLTGIN